MADDSESETRPSLLQSKKARVGSTSPVDYETAYGIGSRLLSKMGFQPGQGLGKQGTGITEPIGLRSRPAQAGLGRALGDKRVVKEVVLPPWHKDSVTTVAVNRNDAIVGKIEEVMGNNRAALELVKRERRTVASRLLRLDYRIGDVRGRQEDIIEAQQGAQAELLRLQQKQHQDLQIAEVVAFLKDRCCQKEVAEWQEMAGDYLLRIPEMRPTFSQMLRSVLAKADLPTLVSSRPLLTSGDFESLFFARLGEEIGGLLRSQQYDTVLSLYLTHRPSPISDPVPWRALLALINDRLP